jgi:uncharacterized integral membrane protein (TIGR00698 family)
VALWDILEKCQDNTLSIIQKLSKFSGILFAAGIAAGSIFLSDRIGFNDVLLALIIGIAIGNVVKLPKSFNSGIKTSSGLILELAIVLMAFSIDYKSFIELGWQTIVIIVATMTIVLIATAQLAKVLKCPGSTGWLVGFGTAICGSSAIAALAPSVTKDKSDIGISLAVVNLFGLIGMVAIPFITANLLTNVENGILIGASLHSMGNVAGAGFGMSNDIGELAVTVKLGRIAMLTPALLIFRSFLKNKRKEVEIPTKLPWYLIAFIVISIAVSFVPLQSELKDGIKFTSTFFLAIAMAAIGLRMSFKTLLGSGKKGLIFGAILFAIQLIVIVVLMWMMR